MTNLKMTMSQIQQTKYSTFPSHSLQNIRKSYRPHRNSDFGIAKNILGVKIINFLVHDQTLCACKQERNVHFSWAKKGAIKKLCAKSVKFLLLFHFMQLNMLGGCNK